VELFPPLLRFCRFAVVENEDVGFWDWIDGVRGAVRAHVRRQEGRNAGRNVERFIVR
jgi:hypothetical protein